MKKILLFFLLVGFVSSCKISLFQKQKKVENYEINRFALPQDSTSYIFGKVIDSESKTPLPFAGISLFKDQQLWQAVQADLDGNFKIEKLVAGLYSINFSYGGYQEVLIPKLIVEKNKKVQLLIFQNAVWLYQNSWHGKTHSIPLTPDTIRIPQRN